MRDPLLLDANSSPAYGDGVAYEEIVASELEDAGFVILSRNYRIGHYEADLVALEGDVLCIIEVKSRRDATQLSNIEALINRRKRMEMISLGNAFARGHRGLMFREIRFDFALVLIPKVGEEPVITYYRNAFLPATGGRTF